MKKALQVAAIIGTPILLSGPVAAQQVEMASPREPLVMLTGKDAEQSENQNW